MRIALVIDAMSLGGAQKHILQLGRSLRARGDQVTLICLNDNVHPSYRIALENATIELIIIGTARVLLGVGLIMSSSFLKQTKVDLIITMLFVSTLFGRISSRLAGGIPVLTSIQARNVDYKWWQLLLLKITSPLTTVFVSNSRSAAEFAKRKEIFGHRMCGLVRNAVEPAPKFANDTSAPLLDSSDKLVGTVGRLNKQKGFDILLRAFAKVQATLPGVGLVILGEGPERQSLEALTRHHQLRDVRFLGERAEVGTVLARLAIFALPSRFEGTPNAAMEAMAFGLPIVATEVDGSVELLDGGRNGWGVKPEDVDGLAEAIIAALSSEMEAKRRGCAARDFVFARYSTSEMFGDYARYIEAAVPTDYLKAIL